MPPPPVPPPSPPPAPPPPPFQFVWEGSDHLGEPSSIFTGIFPKHYSAPGPFNFDEIWRGNKLLTEIQEAQRPKQVTGRGKTLINKKGNCMSLKCRSTLL